MTTSKGRKLGITVQCMYGNVVNLLTTNFSNKKVVDSILQGRMGDRVGSVLSFLNKRAELYVCLFHTITFVLRSIRYRLEIEL